MKAVASESPMQRVLSRLQRVRKVKDGYIALCPAHADHNPSLSVTEKNGRVLFHCFAGCPTDSVLTALNLKPSDLFEDRKAGLRRQPVEVEHYDYTDADGKLLFQVVRYEPKGFRQRRPDGKGGWIWNLKGVKIVPYRLPRLCEAVKRGKTVFVVEGEKDVHTLEGVGLVATTNPGGAGKWREDFAEYFRDVKLVIIPDNDRVGKDHAQDVAAKLSGTAASIKIIDLPGLREKQDVSDWVNAGHTADELRALAEGSPEFKPAEADEAPTGKPQELPTANLGPDGFALTDLGNAERLIAKHGENLRYNVNSGTWLVWNGQRWKPDATGQVQRLARQVVRGIYSALRDIGDFNDAKELLRHIKASEQASRLSAMVELARDCEGIPVESHDLDADPWLLCCRNGVLDLRTGELREHRREDLMTRMIDLDYHPASTCPRWLQFLDEVFEGNTELIEFVQRAMGYSLTGDTSEQCLFLLHGSGSNGKSTLLTVLSEITADYHRKTPTDTLLEREKSSIPNDLARLCGARVVTAVESSPGRKLAETLVKELCGGDRIAARFLHREWFEFVPQFKLWLAVNHLPTIDGQDYAIWRRIRLIPFNVQFNEPGAPTGPYRDKMLLDKLRLEYTGILTWMVEGCLKWQSEGLGNPTAVEEATQGYRQEMDTLGDFFADCCVIAPNARVKVSELYEAYTNWCERTGERYPLSKKGFGLRVKERGTFRLVRTHGGERWWHGVRLKTERENEDGDVW